MNKPVYRVKAWREPMFYDRFLKGFIPKDPSTHHKFGEFMEVIKPVLANIHR